ncbi:hypothetical protein [Corynebacterium sp. A21]|uniref:hypothetical protein n=1 Tax=Corynebacterium sp. A21 TaxID=3457318 RepID=UPI003FCF5AF0
MPTEAWRVMNLEKPSLGSHVESLMIDSESEVPLLLSDTWFRLDAVRLTFTYR